MSLHPIPSGTGHGSGAAVPIRWACRSDLSNGASGPSTGVDPGVDLGVDNGVQERGFSCAEEILTLRDLGLDLIWMTWTTCSISMQDVAVQTAKIFKALNQGLTGRPPVSAPTAAIGDGAMDVDVAAGNDDEAVRANAVRPLAFKTLVGKGHAEFSSAR